MPRLLPFLFSVDCSSPTAIVAIPYALVKVYGKALVAFISSGAMALRTEAFDLT